MGLRDRLLLEYMPRLRGHKQFIVGNHDIGFKEKDTRNPTEFQRDTQIYRRAGVENVRRGIQDLALWLQTIQRKHPHLEIPNLSIDIQLSHFSYHDPTLPNSAKDKYVKHRPHWTETLLLYGHTHQNDSRAGSYPNQINVGVDAWNYRPVSLGEVLTEYSKEFVATAE